MKKRVSVYKLSFLIIIYLPLGFIGGIISFFSIGAILRIQSSGPTLVNLLIGTALFFFGSIVFIGLVDLFFKKFDLISKMIISSFSVGLIWLFVIFLQDWWLLN